MPPRVVHGDDLFDDTLEGREFDEEEKLLRCSDSEKMYFIGSLIRFYGIITNWENSGTTQQRVD